MKPWQGQSSIRRIADRSGDSELYAYDGLNRLIQTDVEGTTKLKGAFHVDGDAVRYERSVDRQFGRVGFSLSGITVIVDLWCEVFIGYGSR